ncbi:GTPase IMAP family member 7-like [Astyanax mexicanus]|uniref:GTPase IMAP family member 7-like n=1 Tax=Astyanax mexicanus TaxID=7994 RepID=A0A8T2M1W0_ASTMX|nr:GTPase IMAP family member 7-like [Astyanax mexicanus]
MASYTQKTSTDDLVQIVLIGNSGSGKSCSGNTILNKKHFLSDASAKSVTLRCQIETKIINGRTVTVVDTPGWDCTERSLQEVEREIQQVLQTLNGPYSFLLVIRIGLVEVEEINKIYRLRNVLGSSYLEHTTILFTHSDDLEFKTFEEFLREGGKEFQELLRRVGHRCHSWNNRDERSDEDVEKVLENLKKTEIKKQLEIPPEETGSCGKRFRKEETPIDAQTCQNTVRVLFLGMTKGGKTSSIRTLQEHGELTENKNVYKYVAPELSLQLIDSPGFDENPEEIQKIICESVSTYKPHVMMIVMSVGRFTPATKRIMQHVQDCLGRNAAKNALILFTGKDNLEEEQIDSFIQENTDLRELVRKNGNRVHALNNRDARDWRQVEELLQKIAIMHKENRGEFYKLEECPESVDEKGILSSSEIVDHWGEMASYTQKTSTDDLVQIVLIGNSGSGKSCSGNTILNKKHFLSDASAKSDTLRCQIETEIINGRKVTVVDTPGWDCTERSLQAVERKIQQVLQTLNGPYSFLLVIKVGLVEVEEINKIYRLRNVLGSSYLEHTTILFTHSDDLEFKTFEEFLREGGKEFQELLRRVGHRCHSWNNRDRRSDEDVEKVLENLKKTEIKKQLEIPPEETGSCGKRFRKEETPIDAQTCQNTVRVLFLGMTKVGKTSSIRTLQEHGELTENKNVYKYVAPELSLQLIDSPGFDKNPEEIQKIICKSVSTYKPHVMMIVMSVGRFTPATKRIMQHVQDCLGRNAAKNALILFTGKDNLEGKPFDSFMQENADLRELVRKNGNRVHALNNRDARDRRQVEELLQKIAIMHEKNRGEFYKLEECPGSVGEKGTRSRLTAAKDATVGFFKQTFGYDPK